MSDVEKTAENARVLNLRCAVSNFRVAKFNNKEHTVVDVTALVEGVIHAVNASNPEFVPIETLQIAPTGWNGRPVVLTHPKRRNVQISANSPSVLEEYAFGHIFNTRVEGKTLRMEAWIEPDRVKQVGGDKVLTMLEANEPIEVSVGAFVSVRKEKGEYNGKRFAGVWTNLIPDHLAFLPDGVGACNGAMGCGANRTLEAGVPLNEETTAPDAYLVTAEGLTPEFEPPTLVSCSVFDESFEERIQRVNRAIHDRFNQRSSIENKSVSESFVYAQAVYDDWVLVNKDGKLYGISYTLDTENGVVLGDTLTEVKVAYVAAETVLTAIGKRNNVNDQGMIQTVHDHAVSLGASCVKSVKVLEGNEQTPVVLEIDGKAIAENLSPKLKEILDVNFGDKNVETPQSNENVAIETAENKTVEENSGSLPNNDHEHASDCGCNATCDSCKSRQHAALGANEMALTAEQRSALIRTLTTHDHSGFTPDDEAFLGTATDERLESFRVQAESRKAERENLTAASQRKLTQEELMSVMPDDMKNAMTRFKAAEDKKKLDLVTLLKNPQVQTVYNEAKLASMTLEQLEEVAKLARVVDDDDKVTFIGRTARSFASDHTDEEKSNVYLNPPDPYEAGLAALKARQ